MLTLFRLSPAMNGCFSLPHFPLKVSLPAALLLCSATHTQSVWHNEALVLDRAQGLSIPAFHLSSHGQPGTLREETDRNSVQTGTAEVECIRQAGGSLTLKLLLSVGALVLQDATLIEDAVVLQQVNPDARVSQEEHTCHLWVSGLGLNRFP